MAAGAADAAWSSVWRIATHRDDVYLGCGRMAMRVLKLSLHASGVWVLAATKESGATFEGNRRARKWDLPPEMAPGYRRGPIILAPWTSIGTRPVDAELGKPIVWVAPPRKRDAVWFSVYFAPPDGEYSLEPGEVLVGTLDLRTRGSVWVVASWHRTEAAFFNTIHAMLADTQIEGPAALTSGSLLWVTATGEGLPLIVDLPPPKPGRKESSRTMA